MKEFVNVGKTTLPSTLILGLCLSLGLILCLWSLQQSRLSLHESGCSSIPRQQQERVPYESSRLVEIAATTSFTVDELESFDKVLTRASFPNERKVILTSLTQAWVANGSMLDCFLDSFHSGNGISWMLDHVVIVAMDGPSYKRCVAIHSHCFEMTTKGVDFSSSEKKFQSKDYLKMTRQKVFLMKVVLQMGYDILFTDGDVMWFRDPFQHFIAGLDVEMTVDYFHGNESSLDNAPNTGFLYARSTDRTRSFYKLWYDAHDTYPGRHDQDVFKALKDTQVFRDIGLKIRFLSPDYFGGFCAPRKNFDKLCTMHSTCCVGLDKKLNDIKLLLEDWKRYKEVPPEKVNWRAPNQCKLSKF